MLRRKDQKFGHKSVKWVGGLAEVVVIVENMPIQTRDIFLRKSFFESVELLTKGISCVGIHHISGDLVIGLVRLPCEYEFFFDGF